MSQTAEKKAELGGAGFVVKAQEAQLYVLSEKRELV